MPIIPVTKVVTNINEFAPFIYENHMNDIFDSTTTFEQQIPIFTIVQPLTAFSSSTLVDQTTPSDGIAFNFRIFVVSNNTGKAFKIEFMQGTNETVIFPSIADTTANTLFSNSIELIVNKDDVLHYHIETTDGQNPAGGKLVMAFMTFEFRPTSA